MQRGCVNINECDSNNGMCRGDCLNTVGSYECGLCKDGTLGTLPDSNGDFTRAGVLFLHYQIEFVRIDPERPEGTGVTYELDPYYFRLFLSSPLTDPASPKVLGLQAYSSVAVTDQYSMAYYRECCDEVHLLDQSLLVQNETVHVGWQLLPNVTCRDRVVGGRTPPPGGLWTSREAKLWHFGWGLGGTTAF